MNHVKLFGMFMLLVFVFCSASTAGVYIEGKNKDRMSNENYSTKVYIQMDRLRVETGGGSDQNMVIIFRDDKNLFWMLDNDKKEYREMTEDDVKKIKSKMDEAMKEMEAQLKNLPPEQRKMMEQMMPSNMNLKKSERAVFTKKETGVKIDKWSCAHYIGEINGVKTEEVWTSDWGQLGIRSKELKVFRDMGKFFSSLAPDMADTFIVGDEQYEKEGGYAGLPVKSINYQDGKIATEFMLQEISQKDLKDSLFEIPSGFSKVANEWDGM